MKQIENLLFDKELIKELLIHDQKGLLSTQQVSFCANTDIPKEPKNYYYGKLYSLDGVQTNKDGNLQAKVQGPVQLEVFFDELISFDNDYYFIGYKLLTNS